MVGGPPEGLMALAISLLMLGRLRIVSTIQPIGGWYSIDPAGVPYIP